ncbi:MAG: exosortase/archaeosortase family protein [Fimbriimonadaceae bacterium]|nr:exosortase/archaeosortase family protein [Fimbriimonadaceae bacterium]
MSEIAAESTDTLSVESPKRGLPGLPDFDFKSIRNSPAFIPGIVGFGALMLAFWELFRELPGLWFKDDGYYSHGVLVPFISAYVIYRWWPKLKEIPVRPFYPAMVAMAVTGWLLFAGIRIGQIQILSFSLVLMLLSCVWFVAGGRWLRALSLPILFLLFGLPIWSAIIDTYTNPLQIISTDISYSMLQLVGFDPYKQDNTTIYLKNFTLDVGVPCSGLKLAIAVSAFTSFFMMIAKLKWWGNLIMVAAVLPLCLFINGLRITLIGVVGNIWGDKAGHDFHDYSGYITLIVCFFLLFKLARLLGWED